MDRLALALDRHQRRKQDCEAGFIDCRVEEYARKIARESYGAMQTSDGF